MVGRDSYFGTKTLILEYHLQKSDIVSDAWQKGWETQPLRKTVCGAQPSTCGCDEMSTEPRISMGFLWELYRVRNSIVLVIHSVDPV